LSLDWVYHIPVLRKTEISFKIVAVEPLRIGAQKEVASIANNPIVKIAKNGERVPFIPGSSLKGVLRTIGEGLWSSVIGRYVHDNKENFVCYVFKDEKDEEQEEKQRIPNKKLAEMLCPVCLTYGVPGFMSKVLVSDFFPLNYSIGVITQASIHRKKGTAQNPRQIEYVEPGSTFSGKLVMTNAPNWMITLVLASLYLIDNGFVKLGGNKSRGFGAARIEDLQVKSTDLDPLDIYDSKLDKGKIEDLSYAYEMWKEMAEKLKERYQR